MTPLFTARRRAEDFNALVEGGGGGTSDPRFADRLALVGQLRDLPPAEPRPAFTADLRERLLEAADELLVPSEDTRRLTLPPRRTARDRLVAAGVGGVAVVGASVSLAVAAQSALPGDMLYPLKRVLESAETHIHTSDEARGESLLSFATDRLDEAVALSATGDLGEGEHVAQALVDFSDQATVASDLLLAGHAETRDEAGIQELRDFTAASMQSLVDLEAVVPDQARDELQYAVQVLDEIDRAAARACPSCTGGIDQIPAVLLTAGKVDGPSVVVPGNTLPGTTAGAEEGSGRQRGSGNGKRGGGDGSGSLPDVQVPGSSGDGGGSSSGDRGPVGTLTDTLTDTLSGATGGGSGGGGGGGGGGGQQSDGDVLTGVPEVDDTVDDVTDPLDDVLPPLP